MPEVQNRASWHGNVQVKLISSTVMIFTAMGSIPYFGDVGSFIAIVFATNNRGATA